MIDMSDPAPDQVCGVCHDHGHLWCCDIPDEVTDTLALLGNVTALTSG